MKYFITLFILSFSLKLSAQNVSLDQLLVLRGKSLVYVEEFLTARKWELTGSEEYSLFKLGSATFAYEKSYLDDKALSFLTFDYNPYNSNDNEITIQINRSSTYVQFVNRIKALQYKLLNSTTEDDRLIKRYTKGNTIIRVVSKVTKDDYSTSTKTVYLFQIYKLAKRDIPPNSHYGNTVPPAADTTVYPVIIDQGTAAFERGDYSKAIEYYKKGIIGSSADYTDYYNIGLCYWYLKDYTQAIEWFKKSELKNNKDIDTKRMVASSYFESKQYTNAILYQKKVIQNINKSAEDFGKLTIYLICAKRYTEALTNSKQGEAVFPKDLKLKASIAHANLYLGNINTSKIIYVKYRDEFLDGNETWYSFISGTFDLFREHELENNHFDEILSAIINGEES